MPASRGAPDGAAPHGPSSLTNALVGVLRRPAATFAALAARPRIGWAVLVASVVTAIGSTVSTLGFAEGPATQPLQGFVDEHTTTLLVLGIVTAPVLASLSTSLWALLAGWLGRLFDGRGSFRGIFTAYAFSILPTLLTSVVQAVNAASSSAVLGVALLPLSLLAFGWTATLWVLATREALRITTGNAVAIVGILAASAFVAMLAASIAFLPAPAP